MLWPNGLGFSRVRRAGMALLGRESVRVLPAAKNATIRARRTANPCWNASEWLLVSLALGNQVSIGGF